MAKGELEAPLIKTRSITRLYGERLRKAREAAKINQRDAAERIGISQATLSRFESGETQPDFRTFHRMGEVYSCHAKDLTPRNQYPSAPLDPVARREFFIRRNARIQGYDPDEAVEAFLRRPEREASPRGAEK